MLSHTKDVLKSPEGGFQSTPRAWILNMWIWGHLTFSWGKAVMHLKEKLDQLSEHPSDLNTCNYMHRKNINPETKPNFCTQENRNVLLLPSNAAIKKARHVLVVFTVLVHTLSEQIWLKCQQTFGRILPDIFQIATRLPITTLHESQGRGLSKHSLNSTTKTPPNHLNWTRFC